MYCKISHTMCTILIKKGVSEKRNKFFEKLLEYNHRPMQFTTTDLHLSVYASVLEHTSHTAYVKDSFSVSSSSVIHYMLIRPSIKENAGPIASVLKRFCNIYSTISQ